MQERVDRFALVEPVVGRDLERIDSAQHEVGTLDHELLDDVENARRGDMSKSLEPRVLMRHLERPCWPSVHRRRGSRGSIARRVTSFGAGAKLHEEDERDESEKDDEVGEPEGTVRVGA